VQFLPFIYTYTQIRAHTYTHTLPLADATLYRALPPPLIQVRGGGGVEGMQERERERRPEETQGDCGRFRNLSGKQKFATLHEVAHALPGT
jgi:hypothetical protein